jgi:hypothetical protein
MWSFAPHWLDVLVNSSRKGATSLGFDRSFSLVSDRNAGTS